MIGVRKIQGALSDRWEILCTTAGIWSKPCGSDVFSGNDFTTYKYNMNEILVYYSIEWEAMIVRE